MLQFNPQSAIRNPQSLEVLVKLPVVPMICIIIISSAIAAFAQSIEDLKLRPIFVTTRVFQVFAKRGTNQELTDQVFKMRTASLSDGEKWMNAFKKSYPGFDIALVRTESRRIFRTSKPSVIPLGRHSDGRSFELAMIGAQSYGDGEKPGTSLIPEITLRSGNNPGSKPLTFSIQPLEVESGMTYFYALTGLKMDPSEYVGFFRSNAPAKAFEGNDIYLVLAYSVDLDKTVEPVRYLDERQSMPIQEKAIRKVEPEVPANLRTAGFSGLVRVRVEISAEGKVTSAIIQYSSFPEINNEVLAAARQWEFPTDLFADNKNPITCFIAFSIAAK